MKRFCLILCAILMLFASAASYADVLIEPENAFYRSHRDECQHTAYRVYVTEEERIVYTAPYGMKILSKGVGTNFGIEWLYTESDGSVWGYWNDWSNAGWIEMSGMKVVYDDISFREEHGSEIVPNTDGRGTFENRRDRSEYRRPTVFGLDYGAERCRICLPVRTVFLSAYGLLGGMGQSGMLLYRCGR